MFREARITFGGSLERSMYPALGISTSNGIVFESAVEAGVEMTDVRVPGGRTVMCQLSSCCSGRTWPNLTMIRQKEIPTAGLVYIEERLKG